jgi:hypothetical protein
MKGLFWGASNFFDSLYGYPKGSRSEAVLLFLRLQLYRIPNNHPNKDRLTEIKTARNGLKIIIAKAFKN